MRRVLVVLGLLALLGLAELALLWRIAQEIGPGFTMLFVLLSALVGFSISKRQGLGVFRSWVNSEGDNVQDEGLVDGLLVLAGGVLLILPGVIGDVVGFALLTPPLRRKVAERIRLRAAGWVQAGQVQVLSSISEIQQDDAFSREEDARIEVIEAEGVVVHEGIVVEERPERLLGP